MISSVNSLATNAVTVLTGQKRAAVPVEAVAPVKSVRRRTGHTDDVFKAGNAIGTMIGIASALSQSSRPAATADTDLMEDPAPDMAMAGTAGGMTPPDADDQDLGMEALRERAAGTGPRAEWARAYLEAQEKRVAD